jgi:hypothetical protein
MTQKKGLPVDQKVDNSEKNFLVQKKEFNKPAEKRE